ncbi:MAG: GHKL domain-containing protein [bacterium]|nr:GHKL domain-containing protein [bacterium]
MYYCILCLLDSIYAMFFSGLLTFCFIKMIFKENMFMSLFISLVIHTGKVLNKILILMFLNNENLLVFNTYKTLDWTAFYINLFALIFSIIEILLLREPLRKIMKHISSSKNRKYVLLTLIYLNFIIILIYKPPDNLYSLRTATDFLMIFTVTGIGIFNVSSEMKVEALTKHYQEIFEYSEANGELLTRYKMQVHEDKNHLLMIKGMLDSPKKNIEKYIDNILEEMSENRNNSNYWLSELRYIPFAGVKNFINYKLNQLQNLGAEIEVFVSRELEKINASSINEKEYNQLSTILGVILDNMIDSINETEEKLISINIYIEDDKIHGEFVNNFSGQIDLSRVYEIGYTTKGEQHGVGLALVAKITKLSDRFECNPQIIDNFFIQHLTIKVLDKKSLPKISKN